MSLRKYSPSEVATGQRAMTVLSERVQWHAGDCDCCLCRAWSALTPLDVHGINLPPAVKTEKP